MDFSQSSHQWIIMWFFSAIFIATFWYSSAEVRTDEECIDRSSLQNYTTCCKVHRLMPSNDYSKECEAEFGYLTRMGDKSGWELCRHKCVMEKAGAIVGDTIHVEQFYRYADYFNAAISGAYRKAIDRCVRMDLRQENYAGKWKCNPLAMRFNLCVVTILTLTCPEELSGGDEMCRKYRTGVPFCGSDGPEAEAELLLRGSRN